MSPSAAVNGARIAHGLGRAIFGVWFLGAGIEFFLPGLQPLGVSPVAREFTLTMIHSDLFVVVKLMEAAVGALLLVNRAVLPALLAILPISFVVFWWNVVLDPAGGVGYFFGFATLGLNLALLLPYRARLVALLDWKASPFSTTDSRVR